MKNFNFKKIGIGIGILFIAVVTYYVTQGKKSVQNFNNPAFAQYIGSYTSGIISSGSSFRVILNSDLISPEQVGSEASTNLFEFSPGIKGKAVWLDTRTVEFQPAQRLTNGQAYEVEFLLSRLIEVSKELSTFEYTVQVMPQNFELIVENIRPYEKTKLTRQKIEGHLNTADFAENGSVETMFTASQDGNKLALTWSHTSDGRQHQFIVEEVTRKETGSQVNLSINGSILGVDHSQEELVEIPALGDFKITNLRVDQSTNQHVVLQFSDPLNETQNLRGLISISDVPDLDYEIRDNEIRIYPPVRQTGQKVLTMEAGVRNILNYRMASGSTFDVEFEKQKPQVRFTGKGSILPATNGLILPFEAVNLKAIDLEIIKVFEKNIIQFLQVNNYEGSNELRRVGRPVVKKMISLESSGTSDLSKWNRFTLDLAELINAEPGAIYRVHIGFKRAYLAYACEDGSIDEDQTDSGIENWSAPSNESSSWDSYDDYYYEDYDWEQRDNPCDNSYYRFNKGVDRNVLASDLGLIAKRGSDGSTLIIVNDIKTTAPISGVTLELYDFQQQLIGTASTGPDGMATISSNMVPFIIIAKSGSQRGYLRTVDGESLSLSNFDVGGEQVQKGLKGFLYGERGVWRPGDSLYMTFILEDKLKLLPEAHPVIFELQNPQGNVANRIVRSSSENGFYRFATATDDAAPTGNWLGRVKVGGTEFSQTVKIETVKPNRLKINLDFGADKLTADNSSLNGNLQVNWLHGAPGKNLKAEFEVILSKGETNFPKYPDYTFEDPSLDFYSEVQQVFEGYTDVEGKARVNAQLEVSSQAPGVLNAVFRGKVFEEGGNFSVDRFSIPYYPYQSFTGIRIPPGDQSRGMLLTDTTHRVDIVTVDADGNPVSRNRIEVSLYKIEWRWWWDSSQDGSVNYMSGNNATPIANGTIRTSNGKGVWDFKVKYPEWGRYLVKAYDPASGHSTAKVIYIDWPGWAGRAREGSQAATMLSFGSDKGLYNVGEKATVVIPGSNQGRALISVENGSKVIKSYWLETSQGDNPFSFDVTSEMTPNVFVNVSLLQAHSQTANDLPIRMFGVIPIRVEDPKTHLNPVISMPDVLEPGQEVVIKVSEQSNQKMTYTLAMVDEGLLDLTRFKTPDAWNRFYAREALGVKTWDLYDAVIGSFGGKLERLLAIGGDGEGANKVDDPKANRFKPVVKFFGPFTLDGKSKEHKFVMPNYIGSVKTMVVAGNQGAYGKTEKVTPVRKPLMVLATLPRVLGPGEKLKLPVTLFTMDPSIRNVTVGLKATGQLSVQGDNSQAVSMNSSDMTVEFDLTVADRTGIGSIEVTATSGSNKASETIEIEIRNPNPPIVRVQESIVEAGQSWNANVAQVGIPGTNTAVLEVSTFPPINLGQRLNYLMQYPHGCIEQTTSSVFPQLYISGVKALTEPERIKIQTNIKAGIERLKLFTTRDGGFAYWPGGSDSESWGSTYAGHFLLEAEASGYFVPNNLIKQWKRYQKSKASIWRRSREPRSELMQAYRLYTLAIAQEADLSAMNRLREQTDLPMDAKWMLAAAYVKAGQPEASRTLINNLTTTVKPYQEMSYSYGSDMRDKAIILETLLLLGDKTKGFDILKQISTELSNPNSWMSTQTTAWCLKVASTFAGSEKKGELKYTSTFDGKEINAQTDLSFAQSVLPIEGAKSGSLKFTSQSKGSLFVRLITEGIPTQDTEPDVENGLKLSVSYADLDGRSIDPAELQQTTSFVVTVTVGNSGVKGNYKNLALTQIFPSGWEINNLRLDGDESRVSSSIPLYQDIRDDRVYTYFDLNSNQSKTFAVMLTASYAGSYFLPAVSCEAMYDRTIFARRKGMRVNVVKELIQ